MKLRLTHILLPMAAMLLTMASCKSSKKADAETETMTMVGPTFNADSAYAFCAKQCEFGPRTMNSEAHDKCGEWIAAKSIYRLTLALFAECLPLGVLRE